MKRGTSMLLCVSFLGAGFWVLGAVPEKPAIAETSSTSQGKGARCWVPEARRNDLALKTKFDTYPVFYFFQKGPLYVQTRFQRQLGERKKNIFRFPLTAANRPNKDTDSPVD